jgi:hypothetical protein
MRITSRRGTIVFFLCLGIGLVTLHPTAAQHGVTWDEIDMNWYGDLGAEDAGVGLGC